MARAACAQRREVRLPDPYALPRTYGGAETPALARQRLFRGARRLLRLHRRPAPQDTVPRDEGALYGQDRLSRLRRQPPAARGALRAGGRARHRRTGGDARRAARGVLRGAAHRRVRHQDRGAHPDRDPQPAAIPSRRGAGLPDARPPQRHAFGRREPAHQPGHVARQQPHGIALHPRRTLDRAPSARHAPPDPRARTVARHGQYGHRRRARGGGDPRRGLHRGYRSRGGREGRRGGFQRHAARFARVRPQPHGRLPRGAPEHRRAPHGAGLEPLDRGARRPRTQPAQHRRAHTPGRHDLHHGRQRIGQIDPREGYSLPGAAASAARHGLASRRFRRAGGRHLAPRLGGDGGPEPDRQVVAFEPRDLHQGLRRDTQALRRAALRKTYGPQRLAFLVQRGRWPLRGVSGRGGHQGRHAVHGRRGAGVRGVRRQALPRRGARNEVPRPHDQRRARHDRGRRHRVLRCRHGRPLPAHRRAAAPLAGGGPGLRAPRAVLLDALGRREPACEARFVPHEGVVVGGQRAVHLRRADHGTPFPRHIPSAGGVRRADPQGPHDRGGGA